MRLTVLETYPGENPDECSMFKPLWILCLSEKSGGSQYSSTADYDEDAIWGKMDMFEIPNDYFVVTKKRRRRFARFQRLYRMSRRLRVAKRNSRPSWFLTLNIYSPS